MAIDVQGVCPERTRSAVSKTLRALTFVRALLFGIRDMLRRLLQRLAEGTLTPQQAKLLWPHYCSTGMNWPKDQRDRFLLCISRYTIGMMEPSRDPNSGGKDALPTEHS